MNSGAVRIIVNIKFSGIDWMKSRKKDITRTINEEARINIYTEPIIRSTLETLIFLPKNIGSCRFSPLNIPKLARPTYPI
jgi:hypothetical protein